MTAKQPHKVIYEDGKALVERTLPNLGAALSFAETLPSATVVPASLPKKVWKKGGATKGRC